MHPKVAPPSRVVRREELQYLFWAVKGAFRNLAIYSCTGGGGGGALRTSATSTEKPLVQSRRIGMRCRITHVSNILGSPGKHSRHVWVWFGQRYHTRRGKCSQVERDRESPPMRRSTSGHQGANRRKRVVYPNLQRSQPRSNGTPAGCGVLEE